MSGDRQDRPELVASPRMQADDPASRLDHLAENRRLVVRRALLATAVGGVIPIPVLDDYFAGRVRAGMLMKIAERRRVDLVPSAAELLGDPREGTALRHGTLTVAMLLALKMTWRKLITLMALGRGADEMATNFQLGMLFDHYCAKLHVGAGIERTLAVELRVAIFAALAESERGALVTAFRAGGQVLGRSLLEAPSWVGERIEKAARRWSESGGRTTDPGDVVEPENSENSGDTAEEARWLDRAASAVESRLGRAEQSYLVRLVRSFERHWQESEARRKVAPASVGTG